MLIFIRYAVGLPTLSLNKGIKTYSYNVVTEQSYKRNILVFI
jgi:hypothetical protein